MEHIRELITAVAQARREAYATAPRDNNDHLEAAMFVAMANALNNWFMKDIAPLGQNALGKNAQEIPSVPEPEPEPVPRSSKKWKHDHD